MVIRSGNSEETAMPMSTSMKAVAAKGSLTKSRTDEQAAAAAKSAVTIAWRDALPETKPRTTRPAATPARNSTSPTFEATWS